MNLELKQTDNFPILIQGKLGLNVILNLSCCNHQLETLLIRPILEDGFTDQQQVVSCHYQVNPAYLYLLSGKTANLTLTFQIPETIPDHPVKIGLRFPGIEAEAIPILITPVSPQPDSETNSIQIYLQVTFPFSNQNIQSPTHFSSQKTGAIWGLISGLNDLDTIPSRWFIAEIITLLAIIGNDYSQTKFGNKILHKLKKTDFFKVGMKAFNSANISHWLITSLSTIQTYLGKKLGLEVWEQWLYSLEKTDLETEKKSETILISPLISSDGVSQQNIPTEDWFCYIILGLKQISPTFSNQLETLIFPASAQLNNSSFGSRLFKFIPPKTNPENQAITLEKIITLTTGISSFDTLPARWFIVEVLLILADHGNQYSTQKQGIELCSKLQRTRFFKNGVIALASAQFPRWLIVSHQAASAFHTDTGESLETQGLLYFWEKWLWSLNSQPLPNILNYHTLTENLIQKNGMNAEKWFVDIILGLTLISPRIAAFVHSMAETAPAISLESASVKTPLENILNSNLSLQR
ncbi:hypothetical protein NO108_03080 [Planktothrix rubescens]|nr:hypothetical protein NO108_03080 [Planktothrix rubescens]